MPKLNEEDGLPEPVMYDASGSCGHNFTYSTSELFGFDAYIMTNSPSARTDPISRSGDRD